jgi:UDP-N-acetylglucosamine--N-acetylmuramyl-(pentapeptide) pyrophosphoryl-undecaprenol N-acetylglucosamine transferase
MIERPRIIFAVGASGGHITPALAIADQLQDKAEILYVRTGKPIEERFFASDQSRPNKIVPFVPIRGKGIKGIFRALVIFPKSLFQMAAILFTFRPAAIVGFGGYPSAIPIIVGALFGYRCGIFELNHEAGLATKILMKICKKVFILSSSEFLHPKKIHNKSPEKKKVISSKFIPVPMPIRPGFFEIPSYGSDKKSDLTLVIFGGSQGAASLNTAISEALKDSSLRAYFSKVIHQAGENDLARMREVYLQFPELPVILYGIFNGVASALEEADIVISRAGMSSVAEITTAGRTSIFIPLPQAGGHQKENVQDLCNAEACRIIEQDENIVLKLRAELLELSQSPEHRKSIAQNARNDAIRHGGNPTVITAAKMLEFATVK